MSDSPASETPDLDERGICALVERFYDRVRADPLLGPVFTEKVHDWPAHKQTLTQFWCRTALRSGSYAGNPMLKHRALPVDTQHFERWLALWEQTAKQMLQPRAAAFMTDLAGRIGHGLMLGMGLRPRGRTLGIPLAGRWPGLKVDESDRQG